MANEDKYDDLTTRRTVLRGAALTGIAIGVTPLVAACGGGSDNTPSGGGQQTSEKPSESPTTHEPTETSASGGSGGLVATSDVPKGGGVVLTDEKLVVTQPAAGDFHCFTAICTHMGCTVGTVSGGTINCPCHGSKYSIKDGSVVNGPAPAPLAEKQIVVKGSEISLA